MKAPLKSLAAGILAASLAASAAHAQVNTQTTAPPAPRLADGVKAQAGYEPVKERLVLANPTRIYSDILMTSPPTGDLEVIGAPVNLIAKVRDWDWYLVGRDGVGVGYVSRGVLQPAATRR